jgi:hypothetical protein
MLVTRRSWADTNNRLPEFEVATERSTSMISSELTLRSFRHARFAARCWLKEALPALEGVFFITVLTISCPAWSYAQVGSSTGRETTILQNSGTICNLNEQVPDRYRDRYNRWKETFLSTRVGRRLWLKYTTNPTFRMTIIVSKSHGHGAEVTDYQWKEGKLVAASIILGHQLDYGYPVRPYYPVLSSLDFIRAARDDSSSDLLAAAKIAHEFGHVDNAANSDATSFQLQNTLIKVYSERFLLNGYNVYDPVLVELAGRMGGIPPEIQGQREYWAETYALRYLLEKLSSYTRRELLRRVRKSLASESAIYSLPSKTEWRILTSSG